VKLFGYAPQQSVSVREESAPLTTGITLDLHMAVEQEPSTIVDVDFSGVHQTVNIFIDQM